MIRDYLRASIPGLTAEQEQKFCLYFDMLTDWNTRMNLTAITEAEGVAQKHFADSVLPISLIPVGAVVADVGTGAGFPGVPIKIMRPDIELVLIDSLGKRVNFLTALTEAMGMDAKCLHSRAEDAGRGPLRESFDIALTRAVAEDIGICLGQALRSALGDMAGIERYGYMLLPMDEALILTAVDISGRATLEYELEPKSQRLGDFDTELVREFFAAFVRHAQVTLHIRQLSGENSHHVIEGCFKSFARSLRQAVRIDPAGGGIPSTKGVL